MKKVLVAALAVGLVGSSLVGPAAAAKKKKKPKPPVAAPVATPVTMFFSNTSGGCADDAYLMVLTEPTEGSNCGTRLSGLPNELLIQAGDIPDTIIYNASEGIPFVLDATKKLTGTIQVATTSGVAENPVGLSAGPTTLVVEISGDVGGEIKPLGTAEVDYTVTPTQKIYPVEFEIELPAELDKAQLNTLSVSLYNRGLTVNHGFYRTVDPVSQVIVPTWK